MTYAKIISSIYLVMRREGKLAFLLRTHTGYKDGFYTLPAGHVEEGESFSQATIRETAEEVGVTIAHKDLRQLYTMHRKENDIRVDIFFEATKWTGRPRNMEPDKHGELVWFPEDNLPYDKIMDYQADVLRALARGEMYNERGWQQPSLLGIAEIGVDTV